MPVTIEWQPALSRVAITVQIQTITQNATVVRINAKGEQTPVRGADPVSLLSGVWFGYDYEAPFNEPVTYLATADNGSSASSTAVVPTSERAWIKNPYNPLLNMPVIIESVPTVSRKRPIGIHQPLGRSRPIVISGPLGATSGEIKLLTRTVEQDDALNALVSEDATVLLQIPSSRFGNRWVALGDITEEPIANKLAEDAVVWSASYQEVDRPIGDLYGDPTASYQGIVDSYATYTALRNAKATYLDIMRGVGTPILPPPIGGN